MGILGFLIFNKFKQIVYSSFTDDYKTKISTFVKFFCGKKCYSFDDNIFYIFTEKNGDKCAILVDRFYNTDNIINDFLIFKDNMRLGKKRSLEV